MSMKDRRVYKFSVRGNSSVLLEASNPKELQRALVAAGVDNDKAGDWAEALWRDAGVRYQAGNITIRHTGYMRYEEVSAAKPGQRTEPNPASPELTTESLPAAADEHPAGPNPKSTESVTETLPAASDEDPAGPDPQSADSYSESLIAFLNKQTG